MKKFLVLILLFLQAFYLGAATKSFSFLRDGVGADILAIGSAGTASATGVNATYWNPAGVSRMSTYMGQLSSMYVIQKFDRHYTYLGAAFHTEDIGNFGINFSNYGVENIEILDELGMPQGKESDEEYSLGLTYSNIMTYQLRYGITLKGNYQDLVGYKALGYSVDIGVQFQPLLDQELYFGIMLQNIIGALYWDKSGEDMLSIYKAGVSLGLWEDTVKLVFDVVKEENYTAVIYRGGVEFKMFEYFFLRGGVNEKSPVAGLGIKYEGYKLDYAFIYDKYELGDDHVISLEFMW